MKFEINTKTFTLFRRSLVLIYYPFESRRRRLDTFSSIKNMTSTEAHETSTNSTVSYRIRTGIIPSCFPADRPLVDDTLLSYYVGFYVFPIIFVIGITGNVLNLAVLNSRGMKTKANRFLSAMAVSDLCFLVIMFILNLVNYKPVTTSNGFVWFHYLTKMTFISLANGFSSSSIW